MKTFNQHLKETFIRMNPDVQDDDIPDAYDEWIGWLNAQEFIKFAEDYGRELQYNQK